MRWKLVHSIVFLVSVLISTEVRADSSAIPTLMFELEGGAVWQSYNDVQIPNTDSGTRFSLVDVAGKGPWPAARLYVTWNVNERHGLRILAAPLTITETSELESPVDFAGSSFIAGMPAEATYMFNSWRLSYRYRFHAGERWQWRIGFTAKIRDAKIRLKQASEVAEKNDLGFVPLLHISGSCRFASNWTGEIDIDALAGGPGRAEDVSLKARYHFNEHWSMACGYRMVEGGADVEEVYTFAWLHFAVVSVSLNL